MFAPRTPALLDDVAALYSGSYFTGAEFGDYASQRPTFARNFRAYLRRMRRYGATGGRLFEVGCAYGFFLEQAQTSFDAAGIDVNAAAIDAARAIGLHASLGEFLDYAAIAPFDVVCMWDTIEHVLEPRGYIEKARALLRDGGLLFMTTGDIGSLVARMRGSHWRQIHPPSHVNYFSRATIARLLQSSGFEVLPIRSIGTRRDLLNVLHGLALFSRRPLVRHTAATIERTGGAWLPPVGLYINLYDTMFVAARKRPAA
ncbi:MAG: class I SAM-dependent methyltransferase [Vicinamibacterales bacterium]